MKTPIYDFVTRYAESGASRMHMPGHKGMGEIEKFDITEVFGHGGVGGSEGLLDRKHHLAFGFTRNCFAEPNLLLDFYDSVNFKNRDWPDPMEIPDQVKK